MHLAPRRTASRDNTAYSDQSTNPLRVRANLSIRPSRTKPTPFARRLAQVRPTKVICRVPPRPVLWAQPCVHETPGVGKS